MNKLNMNIEIICCFSFA